MCYFPVVVRSKMNGTCFPHTSVPQGLKMGYVTLGRQLFFLHLLLLTPCSHINVPLYPCLAEMMCPHQDFSQAFSFSVGQLFEKY